MKLNAIQEQLLRTKAAHQEQMYRIGAAHDRLDYAYRHRNFYLEICCLAEYPGEENRYRRKALRFKARGIVEHDRLLNGIGLK